MPSNTSPSFLLGSAAKTNKNNSVDAPKNERGLTSSRLQDFGRTYLSVSPLVTKSIKNASQGDARKELARLTKTQEQIYNQILTELGLRDSSEITSRSKFQVSRCISELIASSDDLKDLKKEIKISSKYIVKNVDSFLREREDISSDRDVFLLADNNSTNLKLNAIKPALEFFKTLKSLLLSNESIDNAIRQQIDIAILMAKDICFNHDQNASLWDRELLFVSLISPCMELVHDGWLNLLSKKLSKTKVNLFFNTSIGRSLPKLKQSIENQDMGHIECIEDTLEEIARAFSPMINFLDRVNIDYGVKSALIKKQIALLDKHLSKSWDSAVSDIRNYLETLTEDKFNEWVSTEGSKKMDLSKLEDSFNTNSYLNQSAKILRVEISDKDLTGESFYRLIQAWGLTDTLCKIRQ